ncbi:calcium-binding protein [Gallionella capsiferriformans]|uniref:Outer membrane adhesin like protein n=1 Tax=Gallionella capsiferriformans (strain ES-2) TaxID=395494 RepID=D9SG15_GALCS|nr:calcium-binding protein [Gallionella capsiferriformans]ADL55462.1 outer membrane adhesin like protein [Gallionella capsiferriformans ES-2]
MANLNLDAQQLQNSNLGITFSNLVYDLNNAAQKNIPSVIQVGQFLPSGVTDVAGSQAGYVPLPNINLSSFETRHVLNSPTGLNAFIALDTANNTVGLGVAGLNGAFGTNPGSAADTTQAAQFMQDQFKDFVLDGGLQTLREAFLNNPTMSLTAGGQSAGAAVLDAIIVAAKHGVPQATIDSWANDRRLAGKSLDDVRSLTSAISGFDLSNLTATKVNGLNSEYLLTKLGFTPADIAAVNLSGATITAIRMVDPLTGYGDVVTYIGGKTLGTMCEIGVNYDPAAGNVPGNYLGWYHRLEGALAKALATNDLNSCSIIDQNPLPLKTTEAILSIFDGLSFDDNAASYGGLAAMALFTTAFSAPSESAQFFGKLTSSVMGGGNEALYNMVGGVIEGAIKLAALSNPVGFIMNVGTLLFGSKLLNAAIGASTLPNTDLLPSFASGVNPIIYPSATNPSVAELKEYRFADHTDYYRPSDGVSMRMYNNGDYGVSYGDGTGFGMRTDGSGYVSVAQAGSTPLYVPFVNGDAIRPGQNGGIDIVKYLPDGLEQIRTVNADGTITSYKAKPDGTMEAMVAPIPRDGAQTLYNALAGVGNAVATYAPPLIDALSLIKAIQTGQPLPIVASGLRIANDFTSIRVPVDPNNPTGATYLKPTNASINGASNVAGGVLSLMSLDAALKRGDSMAAITAGAQAISYSASAYASFGGTFSSTTASSINSLNTALPYLNIVNSIVHGDAVGAAMGAIAMTPAAPVAWAYYAFNMIDSLFSSSEAPPEAWGSAHAQWSGFTATSSAVGEFGGLEAANQTYGSMLSYLDQLAAQQQTLNPGSSIGVIANRLPGLSYRNYSGYQITDIDPLTGVQVNPDIKYDLTGRPYNAPAGSVQASQSLTERMIRVALARGAIAPTWEIQTAALQTLAGDPMAGLTEEERAGRAGLLASQLAAGASTQTFRAVALDLNGDGVQTTGANKTVAFDVDNSGYLKNTAWLSNADGFLFLDRNLNGQIDAGNELFSNSAVSLTARGLNGMRWVDSNYDGKLSALDPVWNELKVWQDANGNGAADAGEVQTLGTLGISALDYAMGTFTQNGQLKQLASPDLAADTSGTRTHVVPEGIIIQSSQGQTSLLVTRVDDKSLLEANRDGITSYEDTETLISAADLLANDTLAGLSGQNISLTGVSGFTHGTGFLDGNGYIHYTPEANYFGAAQFNYTLQAGTGQTATATVNMNIQNVNDAPTVTIDQHVRALYGYASRAYVVGTGYIPASPQYAPYTGYNYTRVTAPVYGVHNTILTYVDTDGTNNATLIVSDVDNAPGTFTFDVVAQAQKGQGSVDASGNVGYTNWVGPNTPGAAYDSSVHVPGTDGGTFIRTYTTQADPFTVRVTDAGGASATIRVNTVHSGAYNPALGSGGGGGKKPISIDLGNDGFGFTNVNDSNIFFDINSDGFKHRTAWPTADDGLLALDANGNGTIDNGSEISFAAYLDGAQTDLQGLAAFDTNNDGVFSALDAKWNQFGVWQDVNQNGITDAGEFKSLDQMGISAVGLSSDGQFSIINGQSVHGMGQVTKVDGSTLALADVTLAYSEEVQITNADGTTSVTLKSAFAPSGETVTGTADKDLLLGNNGNTIIEAMAGDDVVMSDIGNDMIDGGAGSDLLYAGDGNDLVIGGTGDDVVFAGLGDDVVLGGDGHDALLGEGGNDVMFGGAGNDMLSGGDGNNVLSGDAGDDQVYGGTANDALFGGTGTDELSGMEGYDRLDGGAGNDLLDGGAQDDALFGGAGDDTLIGGAGNDTLDGGAGNDTYRVDSQGDVVTENINEGVDTVQSVINYTLGDNIENLTLTDPSSGSGQALADINGTGNALDNIITGNSGNNLLNGGRGADTLNGGAGNDTYLFNLGDGADTIIDSAMSAAGAGINTLVLGAGITAAMSTPLVGPNGEVTLDFGRGDSIRINQVGNLSVQNIQYADGSIVSVESLLNVAPVAHPDAISISEDSAQTRIAIASLLANDTDANALDTLSLTGFDAISVQGNAVAQDVSGNLVLNMGLRYQSLAAGQTVLDTFSYTIADSAGAASATSVTATIVGANDAPVAASPIVDQATWQAAAFGFTVPVGTFTDIDQGDVLNYSAVLSDGSTLPGWLSFDAVRLSFTGSPGNADVGSLSIVLTATDTGGLSASSAFHLNVANVNDAPVVTMKIADQLVAQGKAVNLSLPAILFTDLDFIHGDRLTYSASLADGSALPAWLSIDPATGRLNGTAGMGDLGALAIRLTATDTGGLSATTDFNMTVASMITGTSGNDTLFGSYGDDVYLFSAGSGQDTIYDFGGIDTIRLAGLNPSQVSYARELGNNGWPTYDLVIKVNGTSDSLRIVNYYINPVFQIEKFVFDDGTVLGTAEMNVSVFNLRASSNDSVVRGGNNGNSNDTYLFGIGSGQDKILDFDNGIDTVKLVGLNPSQVSYARELDNNGWPTYDLVIKVNGTSDSLRIVNYYINPVYQIEKLVFDDGTVLGTAEMNAAAIDLRGSGNSSVLRGGGNGSINDTYLFGMGSGQDRILDFDNGIDTVKLVGLNPSQVSYARELDNNGWPTYDLVIKVNGTSDSLRIVNYYINPVYQIEKLVFDDGTVLGSFAFGYAGYDILQGGNGNDALTDSGGNNLLIGGAGADTLTGSTGNELFAGGAGNDTITTGSGADVIAFNRGDGMDVVNGGVGTDNVVSLGRGINYADLALSKVSNNLILEVGNGEQITFANWYDTTANNKSVLDLQVMADAMAGFNATSTDPLLNQAVQNFNFTAVANAFDQARGTSATFMHWSATNSLLAARLSGTDTAALGGDLAHQYGTSGSFTGMNLTAAQTTLNDPLFGAQAQTLHALQGLQGGAVALQ